MKIILVCVSCEQLEPKKFRAKLRHLEGGIADSVVVLDAPLIAGEWYTIMIRGPFIQLDDQRSGNYISDLQAAEFPGGLKGTEYKTEMAELDKKLGRA